MTRYSMEMNGYKRRPDGMFEKIVFYPQARQRGNIGNNNVDRMIRRADGTLFKVLRNKSLRAPC
jgi:hypothetical protein